jgi:hypothetical protein
MGQMEFVVSFFIGRQAGLDSFPEDVQFVSSNWESQGRAIFKSSSQNVDASSLEEVWAYNDDDDVNLLYIEAIFELTEEILKGEALKDDSGLPSRSGFTFICGDYVFESNGVEQYED